MDYSRIPTELKNLKQWVCAWDSSKVPMKAFERKAASSTAPDTWGTFEQAQAAVEDGTYNHLGFVFADNGLVGIDIDAGFEDGLMTPLCADIMKACHSYTEKSRSGRGVHILLRGDLPFTGRNNLNGVEIYKARRFFIMTGKVVIFPEIIEKPLTMWCRSISQRENGQAVVNPRWFRKSIHPHSESQRAARSLSDLTTLRLFPGAETFPSLHWQEQCTTQGTASRKSTKNSAM